MTFWVLMLLSSLLLPLLMLGFGWLISHYPPKKINSIYGYRTRRSSLNPDTWQFAQSYFARLFWKWGLALLPVSVLAMLPAYGKDDDVIGIASAIISLLECIPLFLIIWQTERALQRTFDETGRRLG